MRPSPTAHSPATSPTPAPGTAPPAPRPSAGDCHRDVILHTETSKSVTLETTPSLESGQYKLYYVYRSIPRDPTRHSYTGPTIFDIRSKELGSTSILELSGSYFTDRETIGRVRLEQESGDVHKDVSFY